MTIPAISDGSLETQLDMLRSITTIDSARRVQDGIKLRVRLQRRQVIVALTGAVVAAIATLLFVLQGHPFGYFALTTATAVLILVAWRSAHQAANLAALKSGASLIASWRAELRQQLHHTLVAQFLALGFAAMTGWVVWQAGTIDFKAAFFLAATAGIVIFAAYQFLVIRPSLKREMDMLDQGE